MAKNYANRYEIAWLRRKVLKIKKKQKVGYGVLCFNCGLSPSSWKGTCAKANAATTQMAQFLTARRGLSFWCGVRMATALGIDLSELQKEVKKRINRKER